MRQDGTSTKSPGCRGNCHHDMSAMNKRLAQMSIATYSSFAIEAPCGHVMVQLRAPQRPPWLPPR